MNPDEIQNLLLAEIPDSQVEVNVEGSHVNLVVVSNAFEGLNPVKKQQMVYAVLQDAIASGAIHAVNMKTYTQQQWASAKA